MKVQVYDILGNEKGSVELSDNVFNIKPNKSVIYYTLKAELANARQGTHSTKGRSDVQGSGAKPWRQKGTGRARAGSRRSPLWRGGGTIFGPTPRDYSFSLPKRVKGAALKAALSLKCQEGKLILLDDFPLAEFKTRQVLEMLKRFQVEDALIVTHERNTFLDRSARNIPNLRILHYEGLNVYDILNHEHLILLSPVLQRIQGVPAS
jgi:large subunit ribosomal protein L4